MRKKRGGKNSLRPEKSYVDGFQKTTLASRSTIVVKPKYLFSSDINVDIRTDLTGLFLRDGNSYSRKEIDAFLKSQIQEYQFKDGTLGKYDGVKISVTGFIKFNGEEVQVAKYETSTSISDRWDN